MFLVIPSPQKCTCSTKMLWQTSRNKNKEKNQVKNKDSKQNLSLFTFFLKSAQVARGLPGCLSSPFLGILRMCCFGDSLQQMDVLPLIWMSYFSNVLLFCGILLLVPMCYICHCQECSIGKCGLCTKKMENSLVSGFLFYWLEQFSVPDM